MTTDYESHLIRRGYGISQDQLRALAAFVRVTELPPTYVAFLQHANGAEPRRSILKFTSSRGDEDAVINRFYASDRGTPSAMSMTDNLWSARRLPKSCLCIAEDGNGNFLVLSLEKPTFGAILFWDHEQGHTDHDDGDGIDDFPTQITMLAASIDDVLEHCLFPDE